MEVHQGGFPFREGWTIDGAERLLSGLPGVLSVRVVARPGGEIDEIHVLTTREVSAKQTVRNVESALLAQFDLGIDHRKVSVAQTDHPDRMEGGVAAFGTRPAEGEARPEPRPGETRLLFVGHTLASERAHRVRLEVEVEWKGERFSGSAASADLLRSRLEAAANATLRALEQALAADEEEGTGGPTLALDGVKIVEAFDRRFVLVAVHAMMGREVVSLAGATAVDDSPDRSVILATLQATDRWLRGRA